jgi:hypothetical protein
MSRTVNGKWRVCLHAHYILRARAHLPVMAAIRALRPREFALRGGTAPKDIGHSAFFRNFLLPGCPACST